MFNWLTKRQQPGIFIYRKKLVGEPLVSDEAHRVVGYAHSCSWYAHPRSG